MRFDSIGSKALEYLENTRESLFITGKAGTGKSTLIKHWMENTDKKYAVLAPTGLAALNIGGMTIHKFFGRGITVTRSNVSPHDDMTMISNLDTIIIDEISMVRSDLLDCVSRCLQLTLGNSFPFGGMQIIFVGDMFQLPPIVPRQLKHAFGGRMYDSELFISSTALQSLNPKFVELKKIYRQEDEEFKSILNNVREGIQSTHDIRRLNENECDLTEALTESDPPVTIAPTNAIVNDINDSMFRKLEGYIEYYYGTAYGISDRDLPVPIELKLKSGARVMACANHKEGDYVNGDMGVVREMTSNTVEVEFDDGREVTMSAHTREVNSPSYNEDKDDITYAVKGKYAQIPLKLARAVTIHKSQGLTFDKCLIHQTPGSRVFSPGQMYVALSRVRSLEGLYVCGGIRDRDIVVDQRVLAAYQVLKCNTINMEEPIQGCNKKQNRSLFPVESSTSTQSKIDIKLPQKGSPCSVKGKSTTSCQSAKVGNIDLWKT